MSKLIGTVIHEAAHALFRYALNDYGALAAYTERARMPGYGSTNIEEDLCEAVRMYFQDGALLKEIRPHRHAFIDARVSSW